MTTWDPVDTREFVLPDATSAFMVGPHNLFVYDGLMTLNDRTALETVWVDEMTGFESPDIVATAQSSAGEDGELPDPGSIGGRTVGLTGWIQAGSYMALMDLSRRFLDAFTGVRTERELLITTHPGSKFGHQDMFLMCRPSDRPTLSTKIETGDFSGLLKRSFSLSLRASLDPTFRSSELHYQSFIPQIISTTGRVYDRTYDLAYSVPMGPDDMPSDGGNVFQVINRGNYYAAPVIRFNGRMSTVVLTNRTTDQVIRLNGQVDSGDSLEINVKSGEITDSEGRPAAGMFNTSSDWLQLAGTRDAPGGVNELDISLSSFGSLASVELSWRDTQL